MIARAPNSNTHPSADALQSGLSYLIQEGDAHRIELATSLHKEVAGGLVACTSVGEMIRLELEHIQGLPQSMKLLGQLDTTLRQSLQVVREMTESQFPSILKAFGLNVALQQHLRAMAEHFSGSVILHTDGDEPAFDLPCRLNLFRIVQSLISLCARYANASWIEVTCRSHKDRIEISINHDGKTDLWTQHDAAGELAIIDTRCLAAACHLQIAETTPAGASRISITAFAQPAAGACLNPHPSRTSDS